MGPNASLSILKRIVTSLKHMVNVQLGEIVKIYMLYKENKQIVTGGQKAHVTMLIN